MNLSRREEFELRALVAAAWPHRGTPDLREHVERIVAWNELRALATIELRRMSDVALERIRDELERRRRLPSVDELIELLRHTDAELATEAARAA